MDLIKIKGEIEKLELEKGDIIVIRARGYLPLKAYESMVDAFEHSLKDLGYECHVVICDDAMNITAIIGEDG
jgi:hypothetical protein